MSETQARHEALELPGNGGRILYERGPDGTLLRLSGAGRTYIEWAESERRYDDGFVRVREARLGTTLLRHVRHGEDYWVEPYRFDERGYATHVDGVDIERDAGGRIVGCRTSATRWRYHYAGAHLARIDTPDGTRRIRRDADGRPVAVTTEAHSYEVLYDPSGRRASLPQRPCGWYSDALGRLWVVRDAQGRIVQTFLWEGFACLGRIDGALGEELAAVFSLDATGTPVRVLSRRDMRRVPRDAFAEGLLQLDAVPGLHGGAQHDGYVFTRARVADPRTGSFASADPFTGDRDDPRRAQGYRGPLTIEQSETGPYAICRYDAVTYADPTGEITGGAFAGGALLALSTLTWSSQHNLAGLFVMESMLNFIFSLFSNRREEFWSAEGLSSRYSGAYGFRFDPAGWETVGLNVNRAWTYQHIVFARETEFSELEKARAFIPGTAFEPDLYGTVLRVEPSWGTREGDPAEPFVLNGARAPALAPAAHVPIPAEGWTRAGGEAEPACPGSRVPFFPRGGLHLDDVRQRTHGPQPAVLRELQAQDVVEQGTIIRRKVLVLNETGLGVAVGDELWLRDTADVVEKVEVRAVRERHGKTRVRMRQDPASVAANDLRVRGLQPAPLSTDQHGAGSAADRLDAQGAGGARYQLDDPLFLHSGGAALGAAFVKGMEAALEVAHNLPAKRGPSPYRVALLKPSGAPSADGSVVSPTVLEFAAGNVPAEGDAIVVTRDAHSAPVLVKGAVNPDQREIEPALPAPFTAAAGGPVRWQPLSFDRSLGIWDQQSGTTTLTYEPELSGSAPGSGAVWIRNDDNDVIMVRAVQRLLHDDLILSTNPVPGAGVRDVDRLKFDAPTQSDAELEDVRALVLSSAPSAVLQAVPQPALVLHRLSGATIPASVGSTVLSGVDLTSNPTTLDPNVAAHWPHGFAHTYAPMPGQLVLVDASEAHSIKAVRSTLTLDRNLAGLGADLRALPLEPSGFAYRASAPGGDRVRLEPVAFELDGNGAITGAANTQDVYMPQLREGELVQVQWGTAPALHRELFRVKQVVEGTELELEGGNYAAVAGAAAPLALMRLGPVDPETGTRHVGIDGSQPAPDRLKVDVYRPNGILPDQVLAVTDGTKTLPAVVTSVDAIELELLSVPAPAPANADIQVPSLADMHYIGHYELEDTDVIVDRPLPIHPNQLVLAVPFAAMAPDSYVDGELSAGTVMIPDDGSESWELSRRESLETHELRHTMQCAMMGPILLSAVPIWLIEAIPSIGSAISESVGGDPWPSGEIGLPEYSAYVPAELSVAGDGFHLDIPDRAGIGFATGRRVQIAQNGVQAEQELGEESGTQFEIADVGELQPGRVYVRMPKSEAADALAQAYAWLSADSLGGLMKLVAGPYFTGIPKLIAQAIHAAQGNNFTDPWWLEFVPGEVPDPDRPARVRAPNLGIHGLDPQPNQIVQIRVEEAVHDNKIVAVDGDFVELRETPPGTSFEIAVVGEEDPLDWVSSRALFHTQVSGLGLMKWLLDPWGQLNFRTAPGGGGVWGWMARIARWSFSSTSWSVFPLGVFVFDNLWHQLQGEGYKSRMEQDASEESGDLYSALSRLYEPPEYVGDIGRYWHYVGYRNSSLVQQSRQDAAGVHLEPETRMMPSVTTPAPPPPLRALNEDREAQPDSAGQLPDLFYRKDRADPESVPAVPGASAPTFLPDDLGWIPVSPALERTIGMHVAFSRPPNAPAAHHIVTMADDMTSNAAEALNAQKADIQTIYFERAVKDVAVTVHDQDIGHNDVLELLVCERVVCDVQPEEGREYALLLQRPQRGSVVRSTEALTLQAQTTPGEEVLEIARAYPDQPFERKENESRPWPQVHLAGPLRIPVRRMRVRIVDALKIVDALDTLTAKPHVVPGEHAFLLVPAAVHRGPSVTVSYAAPPPTPPTDPNPDTDPTDVPEGLGDRYGDGGIYRIMLPEDDPPEETAQLELEVLVRARQPKVGGGHEDISQTARGVLELRPHFRLETTAGNSYTITVGGPSTTLATTDGSAITEVVITPSTGMEAQVANDEVSVRATAPASAGAKQVVVERADGKRARRTLQVT